MAQSESHQPSNILWVILAGILGVFALGGQKSSTENDTSATHNGSKEERTEGSRSRVKGKRSLDPLDGFFALGSGRRRHPFTDTAHLTNNDYERQLLSDYTRDYLIVTVPDPVDSQFGYEFDELMDAIQRALEMESAREMGSYTLDRAWLPWELDRRTPFQTRIVTDWRELAALIFPFRGGTIGEENAGHHDDNPGTLLFRASRREALRIVFLVGENPTAGIDKRALTRAIELIRSHAPLNDPSPIRIVGPFFTGSQTSMRMVLHDQCNRHQNLTFKVISGAATGVNRDAFCTRDGRVNDGRVEFQATVIPNKLVIQAVLHYLNRRDQSRSDDAEFTFPEETVVLLTESNTGFGQEMLQGLQAMRQDLGENGGRLVELHFPLHMAWLRSEYEKARRRQDEKLNLPSLDSLVPRLSNKIPEQDSIPLQDPATTTSANGEMLENTLSYIRRNRIHYVGIIASDARDEIMLASVVRDHCPGVQIFLIGSDLLMSLPEYSYYLKGTIKGSTYPLIPANQDRIDPKNKTQRLFFPCQDVQGCYNAILAQTGVYDQMIEYRPPLLDDVRSAQTDLYRRPPVWISMIGQNGDPVPLQFFTHFDRHAKDYVWLWPAPAVEETGKRIQTAFPTTLIALVLLLSLCVFVAFHAYRMRPLLFWVSSEEKAAAKEAAAKETAARKAAVKAAVAELVAAKKAGVKAKAAKRTAAKRIAAALDAANAAAANAVAEAAAAKTSSLKEAATEAAAAEVAAAEEAAANAATAAEAAANKAAAKAKAADAAVAKMVVAEEAAAKATAAKMAVEDEAAAKATAAKAAAAKATAAKVASSRWEICFYRCCCLFSLTLLLLPFAYLFWLGIRGIELSSTWGVVQLILLFLTLAGLFAGAGATLETAYFRWCADKTAPLQETPSSWRQMGYWIFFGFFVVFIAGWYLLYLGTSLTSWQAMFLERALDLTTGVSPLLPLIFVCLALFWWFCYQLRRFYLVDELFVKNPFPKLDRAGYPFQKITKFNDDLQTMNRSSLEFVKYFVKYHWGWFFSILGILTLGALWIAFLFLPTPEGWLWTWLFIVTFTIGFYLVVANLLRFWLLWRVTKKLLRRIAVLPMARAFSQLPLTVRTIFSSTLPLGRALDQVHKPTMRLAYHQIGLLREETKRLLQNPNLAQDVRLFPLRDLEPDLDDFDLQEDFHLDDDDNDPPSTKSAQGKGVPDKKAPGKKLSALTQKLLNALTNFWPEHSLKDAFGDSEKMHEEQNDKHTFQRWEEMAEELVAIQVVIYLSQFFFQMRNLIWSMTVCGTLLLLGSTSYPFQPERLLLTLLLSLLGLVLAGIVSVLMQMNRDEILSRIARITPGRFNLDWDFVSSVLTYIVPMGTVIILQMSGAFRFILEPLVRMMH